MDCIKNTCCCSGESFVQPFFETVKDKVTFDRRVKDQMCSTIGEVFFTKVELKSTDFEALKKCHNLSRVEFRDITFDGEDFKDLPPFLTEMRIENNPALKKTVVEAWMRDNHPLQSLQLYKTPIKVADYSNLKTLFEEKNGKKKFECSIDPSGEMGRILDGLETCGVPTR